MLAFREAPTVKILEEGLLLLKCFWSSLCSLLGPQILKINPANSFKRPVVLLPAQHCALELFVPWRGFNWNESGSPHSISSCQSPPSPAPSFPSFNPLRLNTTQRKDRAKY
jgi:hypothetical protein